MDRKQEGLFLSPSFLSFHLGRHSHCGNDNNGHGGHMEIYTVAWLSAGVGLLAYFIYSKIKKK